MTGREPDMALDLALWTGVNLKHADVIDAGVERIDKYMNDLVASIDVMHEQIVDAELKRARKQAAKEAQSRHAHNFNLGDLVMVTVADTSLNPSNTDKTKMRWHGPCQVVGHPSPSELHVRLVGYPDTVEAKEVHWTRCRRFAAKEFHLTPQIVQSAQHDFGKFRIREFQGWRVGDDGNVQILVGWHGFEDHKSTWEPIDRLIVDAHYRVRNYLRENAAGHPPLQAVYDAEYDN